MAYLEWTAYFEFDNKEYYFDDYIYINVTTRKDKNNAEYYFEDFKVTNNKSKFKANGNNRIVIDEITGTIMCYEGYKAK